MSSEDYQPRRVFTLAEANATLPLVRAIAEDMSQLAREVIERRQRLASLQQFRRKGSDVYSEELAEVEAELEGEMERLNEYVEELKDLGVEAKNGVEGLVDFPCELDGRIVYLCWKLNEPEVLFWHELEAGYAGRQPLPAALRQQPAVTAM